MNPFLVLLGRVIKDFGFCDEGIFILLMDGEYPVIEKISEGDYVLPNQIFNLLLDKERVYFGDSCAVVSSSNCEPFNRAVALLWLVVDWHCKKDLHLNPLKRRMFWMEIYKAIRKSEDVLALLILLEMFKVFKTEKATLCS